VCWLLRHGQAEEAGQALDVLEKAAPAALRSRLPVIRAQWRLAQAPALKEAGRLLKLAALPAAVDTADLYMVARENPPSRYENNGVRYFWRGLTAHAAGDLATAARAYARALSLAPLRSEARPYFLAAVLQLDQENAAGTANDILAELMQERPAEPAQVLAFIETALLLDNVQGVEKALASLEELLRAQGEDPAAGPSYQARTWLAASRPDKAQAALERALKINPAHLPSLLLAGPIARANEDWPVLLNAAGALEKLGPTAPEVLPWRAEALARQDQDAQAEKAYRDLLDKRPDQAEAYQGLIALRENSGDFEGALTWVAHWRQGQPADLRPLQAEVRLLARAGRDKQAVEAAEKAAAESEAEASLAAARGFLEAKSLDLALTWAKRAEAAAKGPKQAPGRVAARCLVGDVLQAQGQAAREAAKRKTLMNEAIEQYRAVYQEAPGHAHAGRCLALLLAREQGEGEAAFAIAQRLRQGRYNQVLVTGDRLPLDLLDTLGVVYRVSQHHREAIALFRDAAQRYPREPMVLFRLGQAQAAVGLKGEATPNLTRAVQLAQEKLKQARDGEEKTRLQDLTEQARRTLGQ
jgi:tetratricopeptide (TPR) repeat protein